MKLRWKFVLMTKKLSRKNIFVKNFLFNTTHRWHQSRRTMTLKKNFSRWHALSVCSSSTRVASSLVSCIVTRDERDDNRESEWVVSVSSRGSARGTPRGPPGTPRGPPGTPPTPRHTPPARFSNRLVTSWHALHTMTRRAIGLKWSNVWARNDYWCIAHRMSSGKMEGRRAHMTVGEGRITFVREP